MMDTPPLPPPPPESPPPPPPPPPPSQLIDENIVQQNQTIDESIIQKVQQTTTSLETIRSQLTEHEATIQFASTLLNHPTGLPFQSSSLSNKSSSGGGNIESNTNGIESFIAPSIKDGWLALLQNSTVDYDNSTNISSSKNKHSTKDDNNADNLEYPLSKGQLSKATKIHALETSLKRAAEVASHLSNSHKVRKKQKTSFESPENEEEEGEDNDDDMIQSQIHLLKQLHHEINQSQSSSSSTFISQKTPHWLMTAFQNKIRDIREYHARHDVSLSSFDDTNQHQLMDYSLDEMTMIDNKKYRLQSSSLLSSTTIDNNHNPMQSIINQQKKKRRIANPTADGYDLYSVFNVQLSKVKNGDVFTIEEVLGKYLDLIEIHESIISSKVLNDMFVRAAVHNGEGDGQSHNYNSNNDADSGNENEYSSNKVYAKISYPDFCSLLQKGLSATIPEKDKLSSTNNARKKYIRFLTTLQSYLISYLGKVSPLLNIEKEVIQPSMEQFDLEWSTYGGVSGWEKKISERLMVTNSNNSQGQENENDQTLQATEQGIDLHQYDDVDTLLNNVSPDDLKAELARLGLKCGGAPLDRAKRLWMTRDTPLSELPKKLFAKNGGLQTTKNGVNDKREASKKDLVEGVNTINQRRIDIARLEVVATSLLDQLRPTLDATARRAERRLTQTLNEKEREMEEELTGAFNSNENGEGVTKKRNHDEEGSDSDDEDAPIYNPKGVPLGWDGKPIPYWLFKLHGLNHFYPCEICGNESYRGSHNFEKHFAEAKHSYGMRCLGIPNTKHFHGVTKIQDAEQLWKKLQSEVNKDIFDGAKEEEYEDSHGNVLSRATYEDLARQGLL